jgi:hypothetical protein
MAYNGLGKMKVIIFQVARFRSEAIGGRDEVPEAGKNKQESQQNDTARFSILNV